MADLTHKDRDWCVLPEGHDGGCMADWEKRAADKKTSFNNYRGRRYYACRAIGDLEDVIDKLGIEDGSQLPIPDRQFSPRPSDQVIAELKNHARVLLRMVLIFNDGHVSADKLNGF